MSVYSFGITPYSYQGFLFLFILELSNSGPGQDNPSQIEPNMLNKANQSNCGVPDVLIPLLFESLYREFKGPFLISL